MNAEEKKMTFQDEVSSVTGHSSWPPHAQIMCFFFKNVDVSSWFWPFRPPGKQSPKVTKTAAVGKKLSPLCCYSVYRKQETTFCLPRPFRLSSHWVCAALYSKLRWLNGIAVLV